MDQRLQPQPRREDGTFHPACWRQHPALTQELAVQYHGWGYIHRRPDATALEALDYYTRTLPSFRQRVGDLLAPDASKCRMGRHPEPVPVLADAIDRAATDLDARGPDITDVLIGTSFGTENAQTAAPFVM